MLNSAHKTIKKRYKHNGIAAVFLLPWLIGFLFLTFGPMLASFYISFTDYNILQPPNWVGLANYVTMFTDDPLFVKSMKVTFVYVLTSVPLKLTVALGVALLLNKGLRGLGLYRTLYYIPSILGGSVAVSFLWRQIFERDGLFNMLLLKFGIQGENWISNPKYALSSIVLLSTWQFGASMVIFLAGLKQISNDYYEASAIDGASRFRQFWSITMPMLTPIILFNLVMQTISAFQSFTHAFVISNGTGGPINSTLLYSIYLYKKGFTFFQMGYASALAWWLLIIIGGLSLIIFRTSNKWVHYEDGGR